MKTTLSIIAVLFVSTSIANAQAPVVPPVVVMPPAPVFPPPTVFTTNAQHLSYGSTFSEGNTLTTVAQGKMASLYAATMYNVALQENSSQQMRNLANKKAVAEANSKAQIAEAEARNRTTTTSSCCGGSPQPQPARVYVPRSYGRACGYRTCACHRRVPVYRSWCSIRRAYRYRSHCYRTGAWNYDSYAPPHHQSFTWGSGYGPY